MSEVAHFERNPKRFAALLFLVFAIIAGYPPSVRGTQDVPADELKPSGTNSIYAKIVLPMKGPADGEHPLVEGWIARKLQKRGKTELRAVTQWVRLAEQGEEITHVWNAMLDGKRWGCPVAGRVVERTADGKAKVHLSGWAPVLLKVKGTSLQAQTGSRTIAVVDHGNAYVALFVGLPPAEAGSPPDR